MTRKQALMRVCEILNTYEPTDEIRETCAKVEEIIAELPLTSWSEATIFDTIDQWIFENGKIPSTKDLSRKGLPPVPVIKNRFKMKARAFLDQYYPKPKLLCLSTRYGHKTKEEWVSSFICQYESIRPRSAVEYNQKRAAENPTWATIVAICGLQKWNDLLDYCGLDRLKNNIQNSRQRPKKVFSVQRQTDIKEAYESIDNKHSTHL